MSGSDHSILPRMPLIDKAIMGDGCEVYGEVHNSVIGSDVVIEEGAIVRDSIIMNSTRIGKNTVLDKTIVAEDSVINNCVLGAGEEGVVNKLKPNVYAFDLVTVGDNTVIPDGVTIGEKYCHIGQDNYRRLSR